MKNLVYTLFTAVILLTTACKNDEPAPSKAEQLNISISNSLSTSKSTFQNANKGEWIAITSEEYYALTTDISNVSRSGMPEPNFSLNNVTGYWSGYPTLTALIGSDVNKVRAGSFVFAFKYIRYESNTASGARVKLSETSETDGYENLGDALPDATGDNSSIHYYVLKVEDGTATTSSNSYVGFFCEGKVIGFSLGLLPDVSTNWTWGDISTSGDLDLSQHEVYFQALSKKFEQ